MNTATKEKTGSLDLKVKPPLSKEFLQSIESLADLAVGIWVDQNAPKYILDIVDV